MSRFFCSDCTILRFFPEHGPVMVLFLSSHSFGTITTSPYIFKSDYLLFFLSEGCRAHSFVAFEECAEVGLVLETELIGYFLNGFSCGNEQCFCPLDKDMFNTSAGSYAKCLFDRVSHITRGET